MLIGQILQFNESSVHFVESGSPNGCMRFGKKARVDKQLWPPDQRRSLPVSPSFLILNKAIDSTDSAEPNSTTCSGPPEVNINSNSPNCQFTNF